jgi:type III secretion system TyeA family effector delivery regulator
MRIALRELPVWSYQSPEARDSVLEAVQDAMDAAIDREEGYA